jgi:hypothetical protein
MGFYLILIEEDTRRAVELTDDDTLRPIDDEGPIVGHQGNFTEIDLLFLHRFDAPRPSLFVNIPNDQSDGHLDRGRIGHPPQQALLHIIFGFGQSVTDEFKRGGLIKILDRKDGFKNGLEPEEFPFLRFHIGLKKFFIRPLLNFDEIRKFEDFFDLGKVLSVSSVDGNNHCHVNPSRMGKRLSFNYD